MTFVLSVKMEVQSLLVLFSCLLTVFVLQVKLFLADTCAVAGQTTTGLVTLTPARRDEKQAKRSFGQHSELSDNIISNGSVTRRNGTANDREDCFRHHQVQRGNSRCSWWSRREGYVLLWFAVATLNTSGLHAHVLMDVSSDVIAVEPPTNGTPTACTDCQSVLMLPLTLV